jgi:hypothetical protein
LQTQISTFQQQVNAATLQGAKIVDKASQQHALAAIQGVATIVTAMLALVESVSSKAAVAQMAARSTIKLSMVRPYMDDSEAARIIAAHFGEPVVLARIQVAQAEYSAAIAGF